MIRPAQSDLFAVIGHPVGHSLSPLMMNAVFQSLKIPGLYVALDVDALEEDLPVLAKVGFRGVSVTIPHKETALRVVPILDETARTIGAVNTLRHTEEGWEGRNTDWLGAMRALRQKTDLVLRKALVVGAGGAARAIVYGLKREGALVTLTNRTVQRGQELAHEFECDFLPLEKLAEPRGFPDFDVVVQCTSLGLMGKSSESPLPESFFAPGMIAMDIVYRPTWTPFLLAAAQKGCETVAGHEMLLYQGVAQLEWWLERSIPEEGGVQIMRTVLEKALTHDTSH